MSHVLSMRLKDGQMDRLRRLARRLGRTPSEAGSLLLDESLRRAEFAAIDFRDSPVGRQAYVAGSSLAVWEIMSLARQYRVDARATARHLGWPAHRVQAAINYAEVFREEIDAAIEDNAAVNAESLARMLPQMEVFVAKGATKRARVARGSTRRA